MTDLLTSAQNDFQEAIRLDPSFIKGYINLACVYELLGKYNLAIGTIEELSKEEQKSGEAQRILAITYFHNNSQVCHITLNVRVVVHVRKSNVHVIKSNVISFLLS